MPVQIEKILSMQGNKYEIACAIAKYARYLSQKHDEDLEIPVNRSQKEKVTIGALNDVLSGKITYSVDSSSEEK